MTVTLHHGNCLEVIPGLPDCSVDSIVTDPPYELGFMGKKWDASGIAYNVTLWQECLRVLKPGGHLLAFGGTRTYHRMACAIEDAGFEIRDSIHWLYGSGFPKSLDVSKAIDKQAGAEREVIGSWTPTGTARTLAGGNYGGHGNNPGEVDRINITAPATDAAKQWAGWGTALKPAHEPVVVARKPLEGTVAVNVLKYGTGAINIDASRIGTEILSGVKRGNAQSTSFMSGGETGERTGRWPANVILDDTIANSHDDWPRYFYCAKPSRRERNAGLDGLPERETLIYSEKAQGPLPQQTPSKPSPRANHHPTVKPLALMRYLVRLVTPAGGTVLEPFAGSGTTLMAATLEGFNAIGIEMTDEYLPIIRGRVSWAEQEANKQQEELEL